MFDPGPLDPISHASHVITGFAALVVAAVALAARKGGRVHIVSGRIFVAAMLIASFTALFFMFTEFQAPARDAALLAIYSIGSGYLTLQRPTAAVRTAGYLLTAMGVFALLLMVAGAVEAIRIGSPLILAFATLGAFFTILIVGDIRYFRTTAPSRAQTIRRHRHRMAWGVAIAVQAPLVTFNEQLGVPFPIAFFAPFLLVPVIIISTGRSSAPKTENEP